MGLLATCVIIMKLSNNVPVALWLWLGYSSLRTFAIVGGRSYLLGRIRPVNVCLGISQLDEIKNGGKGKGETYPMIRLEVIHLFPKNQRPKVFAEELDDVQRVVEAWSVAGESGQTVSFQYTLCPTASFHRATPQDHK